MPIRPHSNILTKASSPRNFFIFLLFSMMGLPPHNPWKLKELFFLLLFKLFLLFSRRSFFVGDKHYIIQFLPVP